jgi:replicative DNA helicase
MSDTDTEHFTLSVQESISTCVAFGTDDNAAFVASAVDVTLLDPPLNDIVARCLSYRKKYKAAPGREHVDDVFTAILSNKDDKRHNSYQRILTQMIRLERTLNTRYVADLVHEFNRRRNQRIAIHRAAQIYQESAEDAADQIDTLFRESLKSTRVLSRNKGFTLSETAALGFLNRHPGDYCNTGILPLDRVGCVPTKKEMHLFIAARNRGKSFWLNHLGKMALLKGWRTIHYTLENSAEITAQRYFQTLYSGVKRDGDYHHTVFEERGKTVEPRATVFRPDFIIERKDATERYLGAKMDRDYFLDNLRVKAYPTGSLSFEMLERDLDEMELLDGFRPEMVMIDYPQIMRLKPGPQDRWEKLEDLAIQLRGSAVERDYALAVPQQGSRAAESASEVRGHHGSGSIGMLSVADNAITYSQTEAEEKSGIARLYTQKVRNDEARQTVVIAQHYASGQFCIPDQAYYMSDDLSAKISTYTGRNIVADDEEESEDRGGFRREL